MSWIHAEHTTARLAWFGQCGAFRSLSRALVPHENASASRQERGKATDYNEAVRVNHDSQDPTAVVRRGAAFLTISTLKINV